MLVITSDGRCYVGVLKACDQTVNIVMEDTVERVFSEEVWPLHSFVQAKCASTAANESVCMSWLVLRSPCCMLFLLGPSALAFAHGLLHICQRAPYKLDLDCDPLCAALVF